MSASFGDMQTRIAGELARSDMTSQIQAAILSAIQNYALQRFYWNEAHASLVTVSGVTTVAVPSDYLQTEQLELIYNNFPRRLVERDWATMLDLTVDTSLLVGIPTDYGYYENQFWLYPRPNQVFTLRLWYIKQLPALSANGDSNEWTNQAEELIRSRAKADIEANYLRKAQAIAEQQELSPLGFMSMREMQAYKFIDGNDTMRLSTGRVRASTF